MKAGRFKLTPLARRDLTNIAAYLRTIPQLPAQRIGLALRTTLESLGSDQDLGRSEDVAGFEWAGLRSRLCSSYRIYYRRRTGVPEVIAILHGAQDQSSILKRRTS